MSLCERGVGGAGGLDPARKHSIPHSLVVRVYGAAQMSERIGFIGLGIMGRGMAANLLKAGFSLTVWNRTAGRADDLVAAGARMAASPT
jgi:glutamyl-tRNA reductase